MRNILCAAGFLTTVDEKERTALLVISRKASESILIGDDIEVHISEISGDRVKLVINAPKEAHITRKELLETASTNRKTGEKPQAQTLAELKDLLKQKEWKFSHPGTKLFQIRTEIQIRTENKNGSHIHLVSLPRGQGPLQWEQCINQRARARTPFPHTAGISPAE